MAAPGEHTLCEEDLVDDAEVDTLIREAVAQVMGESMFLHTKTSQWTANIVEGCLKRLAALSKPFKCARIMHQQTRHWLTYLYLKQSTAPLQICSDLHAGAEVRSRPAHSQRVQMGGALGWEIGGAVGEREHTGCCSGILGGNLSMGNNRLDFMLTRSSDKVIVSADM